MINISLTVTHDTVTESFTITPYTTWIELCGTIFDSVKISVTQVYYQDHEGDVITLSSNGEWESLKRHCYTGWIHISTDPSKTTRWVFDDSLKKRTPSHSTPLPSSHRPERPNFTSQFEQFGRIMDKYNDLIQNDDKLKQMMQTTATNITLQSGTIDLTQIETHFELLSKTTIDSPSPPLYPHYDTTSLEDTPVKSRRKSLSTTKFDLPSNLYLDPPPPLYEPTEEKKKKDPRRRHTHYGPLDRQIPTSSWGEWPAYSSLHPPPPPPPLSLSTTASPLPTPSAPSEPAINEAVSLPTLYHHHHTHHHHHSPRSLYPRPPVLLPALIKRTSRLLSHWIPPSDSDERRHKLQERIDRKIQQKEQKRTTLQEKLKDKKERRHKGKQKVTRRMKESSSSSSLSTCSSSSSSLSSSSKNQHASSLDRSPFHYPAIPPSLLPRRTLDDLTTTTATTTTTTTTDDMQRLTTSLGQLSTKPGNMDQRVSQQDH